MVVLGFVVALAVILAAAYLFTNAVDMLGGRLDLAQGRWAACSPPSERCCRRP